MNKKGIEKAKMTEKVVYKDGRTKDIVKVVLDVSNKIKDDTSRFAKQFSPTYFGLNHLWESVKKGIDYLEDPDGVQWIKTPARLAHDLQGDCKSFTLFIVSCLQNMGLDYTIRFVSYSKTDKTVTHVYPIAYLPNGQEVIMDAVYDRFDEQKTYTFKKDYPMSEISILSGLGNSNNSGNALGPGYATHLEQLNQTLPDSLLENDVTVIFPHVFNVLDTSELDSIEGVGNLRDKIKALGKKIHTKLVNLIVKILLPKYATFFLFVFVKNPQTAEVKRRKEKQEHLASIIAEHLGVSYDDFLKLVAASIQHKTGKSPAQILSLVTNAKVKGVGCLDPVSLAMCVGVAKGIIEIFKKLRELFGKSKALDKDNDIKDNDGADLNILKEESHSVLTASEKAILNEQYGIPNTVPQTSEIPHEVDFTPKTVTTDEKTNDNGNKMLYAALGIGVLVFLTGNKA
jgi:hypothetical protein